MRLIFHFINTCFCMGNLTVLYQLTHSFLNSWHFQKSLNRLQIFSIGKSVVLFFFHIVFYVHQSRNIKLELRWRMTDSLSGDPECNLTTASVENIGNYTTPQPIVLVFKCTNESYCKGTLQLSKFDSSYYLCMMTNSLRKSSSIWEEFSGLNINIKFKILCQ